MYIKFKILVTFKYICVDSDDFQENVKSLFFYSLIRKDCEQLF